MPLPTTARTIIRAYDSEAHNAASETETASVLEHQGQQRTKVNGAACAGLSGPPVLVPRSAPRFIPQTVQGTYV